MLQIFFFQMEQSLTVVKKMWELKSSFYHCVTCDETFDSKKKLFDQMKEMANIKNAKALITTLPSDSDNLFVVLTAKGMHEETQIISRASNPRNAKKLRIAGAQNVIMPDALGGTHMATLVVTPDVIEFLDHISIQGSADINLEEVSFSDLPNDLKHLTIRELDARNKIGVNIIGYKTSEGEYLINPSPDTKLEPNSKLFVLGNKRQINLLNKVFRIRTDKEKRILES